MTNHNASKRTLLSAALLVGLALGGCRVHRPNAAHCFHAAGDQTCADLDPTTPFCAAPDCNDGLDDYGCVAARPEDGCYSPCGHDSLLENDASCIDLADEGESDTSTDTGTSTETETDTGTEPCLGPEDCPTDAPICLSGVCTICDETPEPNLACFALTSGQAPICLDGSCVECTTDEPSVCTDAALICDPEQHVCVPCTAHDQCPSGAGCDLVLGECLPAETVWHVDGDGGQDFLTIAETLAALGNGSGTLIIHELDAPGYIEGISFAGDRALAIFAAEGERPTLYMTPVSLDVSDGARVYVRGLTLRGDDAALVSGAHVEFDAVSLAPFQRRPLRVDDATLRIRNSMLRTTLDPTYPALDIAGTCDIDIRYATLLGFADQAAISCQGAALLPGSRIRNSMLVNFGEAAAVQCPSLGYESNGLEDATGFVGHTSIGDATVDWFINPFIGDLHLSNVAPISAASAGRWSQGDPLVDFDGDPRPTTDGSPDFVGADRLP